MPGSQRPRPGGRRWRLRWPAPRRHHPSRSARSRVPGLPGGRGGGGGGVAARDGPGGRLWAREGLDSALGPRLGLRDAPPHSALRLRPFPSSLRPARLHFPPSLSPPLLPLSKPPPGCHTVSLRRGGAGRGELRAGPAPPRAGTRPGLGAPDSQVEVPSGALAGGEGGGVREGGSRGAFVAAGRHGEGAGHAPPLLWVDIGRESRSVRSRRGRLVVSKSHGRPRARPRSYGSACRCTTGRGA